MAGKSCARLLVIAGFTRIHAAIDSPERLVRLTPITPLAISEAEFHNDSLKQGPYGRSSGKERQSAWSAVLATPRSGTSNAPLVSGPYRSVTMKMTKPPTVPTSIGMPKPTPELIAK